MGWLLALAWVQAWAAVLVSGIALAAVFVFGLVSGMDVGAVRNAPVIGLVILLTWLFTWRPPSRHAEAASEQEDAVDPIDAAAEPGGADS